MQTLLYLLACLSTATAQAQLWGQCGGNGYAGQTTCASGSSCVFLNEWYSQCQPGGANPNPTTTTTTKLVQTTAKTSTSAPATSQTGSTSFIQYVGRVNPATKELSWTSTGVSFTFMGTTAKIGIASIAGTNSVNLYIDGGSPTVISNVAGSSISVGPLPSGKHTVVLRKRSEPVYGSIFLADITTDGSFVSSSNPTRRIEVIGDSISVGYGLDGTYPCTNSAALEDNPLTYGALAATSLNADYSVVAWSGKGVYRNIATGTTDTSPLIPELYTRYGANDADNSYTFPSSSTPNAVVINLGTNDFSYLGFDASGNSYTARSPINPTVYTSAIVKFAQSISSRYPSAHIFLVGSPMLSDYYPTTADAQKTTQTNALKNAVTQLGSKAHFVDWPTQGSDVGCDYHPNAATHAAEATVLAAAIKSALGW
ncbi:hypothetical protein TWF694_006371 [Orbilia ellipsospora]|uniref:CBM1 domain-containing protein n=1 Tax=Orbilia ellipsospora TaxID=2528407 RepID=A0AAV9XKC3_9PEZI